MNTARFTVLCFHSSFLGESPPPAPGACSGREGSVEKVIGLAKKLEPIALIGPGGIGKTSIALRSSTTIAISSRKVLAMTVDSFVVISAQCRALVFSLASPRSLVRESRTGLAPLRQFITSNSPRQRRIRYRPQGTNNRDNECDVLRAQVVRTNYDGSLATTIELLLTPRTFRPRPPQGCRLLTTRDRREKPRVAFPDHLRQKDRLQ